MSITENSWGQVCVSPDIVRLNEVIRQVDQVAVQSMTPMYAELPKRLKLNNPGIKKPLAGFQLEVEGPPQYIQRLIQLLDDAALKISS